jgi:hypothetical protein
VFLAGKFTQLKLDGTNGVIRNGVNISEMTGFDELFSDGRGTGRAVVRFVAWDFVRGKSGKVWMGHGEISLSQIKSCAHRLARK